MGLNAITKKSESLGKKSKRTFLQVNKYDNAPNAMELIGHICTAAKDIDFNDEFTPLVHHLFEMEDECIDNDIKWNQDIEDRIIHILQDELEKSYLDNTFELKIAVAGGYSAGKSTFMNMLIGNKDYLPTDMNPTSLVNTFLNFSQKIKSPIVRGENIKDNLVLLDEDVLASIRHDTQNANAIANVLKRLIIDVPAQPYVDGITFIDTPGYDNSTNVNQENGTTDRETATNAFKNANVIFWCANIGKQVTKEDLQFIRNNGGDKKPVVILLSRMNSKPQAEIPVIVKNCYETASRQLHNIIDVIAFDRDASLNKIHSFKGNSLSQVFQIIKKKYSLSIFEWSKFEITTLFDDEYTKSCEEQNKLEKEYNDVLMDLNREQKKKIENKDLNRENIQSLKEIIIDGYDNILTAANNLKKLSNDAVLDLSIINEGLSIFKFGSSLAKLKFFDKLKRHRDNLANAVDYSSYTAEYRNEVYQYFESLASQLEQTKLNNNIEFFEDFKEEIVKAIDTEKKRQELINKYKPMIVTALDHIDEQCQKKRRRHYNDLAKIDSSNENDIFAAISGHNMNRFIECFHTGVVLSLCNSLGYNVLTWIAFSGTSEMIDFLVRHKDWKQGIDLDIVDKRGMNILETAVIAHNKMAYRLLLKALPSMKMTSSREQQLFEINDFNKWIQAV